MTPIESHKDSVFALSITPNDAELAFRLSRTADESGLDIIGIQDHPYNGTFFDTSTLISTLAMSTKKIRFFADVSDPGWFVFPRFPCYEPAFPETPDSPILRLESFDWPRKPVTRKLFAGNLGGS